MAEEEGLTQLAEDAELTGGEDDCCGGEDSAEEDDDDCTDDFSHAAQFNRKAP